MISKLAVFTGLVAVCSSLYASSDAPMTETIPTSLPGQKVTFSSYLGGNRDEYCTNIRVDDSGYVYIATETASTDFPVKNAAYGSAMGYRDITLTKLAPGCDSIIYSTYLGGRSYDDWPGLAVDRFGCAYVTGQTYSTNFPKLNAYDATLGGTNDLFITKFNRDGTLAFSTYFGGSSDEEYGRIAVDSFGCVYIAGVTRSSNLPVTNAFDATYNGGDDTFLAKFSADGQTLLYCTYLGGSGYEQNHALAVDNAGCAYVTGLVQSTDYPTTAGVLGPIYYGGTADGYVTKLSADGAGLVYSTYIGGSGFDDGVGLFVDASGHAYVSSGTSSADFPVVNAYDASFDGQEGFICKLSENGEALEYSTFIGGSGTFDVVSDVALDDAGRMVALCITKSEDFPVTVGAYDPTFNGDADGALAIFDATGQQFEYSSYFGGSGYEEPRGLAIGPDGSVFGTGTTTSADWSAVNALDDTYGGGIDVFIIRFEGDTDGDNFVDRLDNCPNLSNPGQEDINGDGIGDACCCVDRVGDVNGSGGDEPTIGDVSALIDAKFISGICVGSVACLTEADVNQSASGAPTCDDLTIGDISTLIDYLFITGSSLGLPDCK
jgi:hypothetical protein